MELANAKNTILNVAIIILAVIFSVNIYSKHLKETELLKVDKENEIKKNSEFNNISQFEKKIDAYKVLLPRKDSAAVINSISDIARESGVKIISIRPGLEQKNADYIKSPFDLTIATDNYHAIGKFISRIESMRDVYMTDNFDIKYDSTGKELTVTIKISAVEFTG